MRDKQSVSNVLFWVCVLYFVEGLPYGLFFDLFPLWLRSHHVSLGTLGALSLIGLAWSLKFLWAPIIDFTSNHRWWVFGANIIMAACFFFLAAYNRISALSWTVLCVYAFCSATNDSAIDGLAILISNDGQLGKINAARATAYRIGLIGAGLVLALSNKLDWEKTFTLSGIVMCLCACFVLPISPDDSLKKSHQWEITVWQEIVSLLHKPIILAGLSALIIGLLWPIAAKLMPSHQPTPYSMIPLFLIGVGVLLISQNIKSLPSSRLGPAFGAILELLKRPGIVGAITFILLYRIGESAAGFMIKPFWMDAGFSRQEIGLFSVNLGIVLSIMGGIVGGWYVDRHDMIKSLWVLGIIPSCANLLYGVAAHAALPHLEGAPVPNYVRVLVYTASVTDSFTGGLGASAFLAYLMRITNKKRASSEYAILTSIFAFSRSLSGWIGGTYAEIMGYSSYFFLTFLLCFPAYIFMSQVKQTLEKTEQQEESTKKTEQTISSQEKTSRSEGCL